MDTWMNKFDSIQDGGMIPFGSHSSRPKGGGTSTNPPRKSNSKSAGRCVRIGASVSSKMAEFLPWMWR
jgi:hypothetical protein